MKYADRKMGPVSSAVGEAGQATAYKVRLSILKDLPTLAFSSSSSFPLPLWQLRTKKERKGQKSLVGWVGAHRRFSCCIRC